MKRSEKKKIYKKMQRIAKNNLSSSHRKLLGRMTTKGAVKIQERLNEINKW